MGVSIRFTPLEGETAHHGGGVCVLLCVGATVIRYQFLCTNPTGREFFVPAGTDLAVKLLKTNGETRGRLFFVSCRPRDQRPNTSSLFSPQAKKQQNSVTMVPPIRRLPAAPILQVSAIALHCVIDLDRCDAVM